MALRAVQPAEAENGVLGNNNVAKAAAGVKAAAGLQAQNKRRCVAICSHLTAVNLGEGSR